ncbi:MAG: alcohol acetyltransferase, partial [Alkalispirochaeta sp.]
MARPVPDEELPYQLDNAALIFPGMLSPRRTTVFRIAATIDEPVVVSRLQTALDTMVERCPYYRVDLRRGLFWYYFEYTDTPVRVEADSRY